MYRFRAGDGTVLVYNFKSAAQARAFGKSQGLEFIGAMCAE